MVEPIVANLRSFMRMEHMDDLRKMIRTELHDAVRKQLGESVGNIKLLADEV